MARTETLGLTEFHLCGFCGQAISDAAGFQCYAVVGDKEEPWHTDCAESVGVNVEYDEDEPDPDFDHDPNYDGAEDEDDS